MHIISNHIQLTYKPHLNYLNNSIICLIHLIYELKEAFLYQPKS